MWFCQGGPHSKCLGSTHGGLSPRGDSPWGGLSLCQALEGVRAWCEELGGVAEGCRVGQERCHLGTPMGFGLMGVTCRGGGSMASLG